MIRPARANYLPRSTLSDRASLINSYQLRNIEKAGGVAKHNISNIFKHCAPACGWLLGAEIRFCASPSHWIQLRLTPPFHEAPHGRETRSYQVLYKQYSPLYKFYIVLPASKSSSLLLQCFAFFNKASAPSFTSSLQVTFKKRPI
jgi:hypothetical protein